MDKILSPSKITNTAFIQRVIEEYADSYQSKKILFRFLKYLFITILVTLSVFSFYKNYNSPWSIAIRENSKNCIVSETVDCYSGFNYEKYAELDSQFRSDAYHVWTFYTNILTIILCISYLPYKLRKIYRFYKWGDLSLMISIWRAIKVLSLVFILPSITWWLWAFTWSITSYTYSSIVSIPYELFGTIDIPWQL